MFSSKEKFLAQKIHLEKHITFPWLKNEFLEKI